jgi:putative ABC transport system permease protein
MSEATLPLAAAAPQKTSFWRTLYARGDDARLAIGALRGHKLRAGLTLLGIVIGVACVCSTMALLSGFRRMIDEGMGGLGASVFQMQKLPNGSFGPMNPELLKRKNITWQQANMLRDKLPEAKQVGAEVWEFAKEMNHDGRIAQGVQAAGGSAEFFTNNSLPIASGRGFRENEANTAARVVVIGASIVDILFPREDPLGQHIRLGRLELEVIGTIERQGGGPFNSNGDQVAAIPIGLFMELYGGGRSINITVMGHPGQDIRRLQDRAIAAFRTIRGLDAQQEDDFFVFSNDSIRETFDQLAGTVTLGMLVICVLSLVVGGIGVMNIMLVAVAERTREIGLRKALGARRSRILAQFVIEAVMLATCGGIIGILIGYAGAAILKFATSLPAQVPPWAVALSICVSCGIGLVFGIYPASRASRLDPAVALRDE